MLNPEVIKVLETVAPVVKETPNKGVYVVIYPDHTMVYEADPELFDWEINEASYNIPASWDKDIAFEAISHLSEYVRLSNVTAFVVR